MKETTWRAMAGACLSLIWLAGCSTGLNRSNEDRLNAQTGITMLPVKGGVEMRLPEAPLFDTDESSIRAGYSPMLDRAAQVLKRSMRPILIEGHTDNQGTLAYNHTLSDARAQAVGRALIARGVPAERIATKGMAWLRPIASNDTAQGRALNRRVEILVRTESEETLLGTPAKVKR
ncbi:OmpA family protein [Caballeronia novacaledonica]|uniref:OmpA family protein n=1 Tax=Caballeronia novacaledonica TaxID=1544861 RepID=UPI001EE198DB|nr:OmpA family protein [Caballeronia novacaledonica]GJH11518.1 OmpA family protein [Caballeronia novacaledonica]